MRHRGASSGEATSDLLDGPLDGHGVEPNLPVGEPQRSQSRRRVGLVTETIFQLLLRRSVVAKAVGFHDEDEVGPKEVDHEYVDVLLRQWRGEPGTCGDRQEVALQLGIGEYERAAIENGLERARTALTFARVQ